MPDASTVFTVSTTGITGTAAPVRAAAAIARAMRGGRERASGVMNQHEIRPPRRQRLETGPNRCLPGRTAEDRRQQRKPGAGGLVEARIVPVDHGLNRGDPLMPGKQTRLGWIAGRLPTVRYCLGTSPPARSPRPAATTTAATIPVMGGSEK